MKRALIVMVAVSVVAWWWLRPRHATSGSSSVEQSARVLADLAADRGPIRWIVIHDRRDTSHGIALTEIQMAPATVEASSGTATIATGAWRIDVNLEHVTEIACERRFIHYPPPGVVLMDVSFRKGPDDEDGFPDELFTVAFPEAREADFRAFCTTHGLRRVGDW